MNKLRRGAKDIGLAINWNFSFVGPGSVVEAIPDAIFLDVGNKLSNGVIDQHQDASLGSSTTELIQNYPHFVYEHLLRDWVRRYDDGMDLSTRSHTITLITHVNPDFDAMVSCFLVQKLIEDGELPVYSSALVKYSSMVDQGEYRVDIERLETATHPIHMAYLMLQAMDEPSMQRTEKWISDIRRGFSLLTCVVEELSKTKKTIRGSDFTPPKGKGKDSQSPTLNDDGQQVNPAYAAWRDKPENESIMSSLDSDFEKFKEDKTSNCTEENQYVTLPSTEGEELKVRAFIAKEPLTCKLHKYWVRASNYPYFLCPLKPIKVSDNNQDAVHFSRYILSLDPTYRDKDGQKPTLQGLGYALETEESAHRKKHGGDTRLGPPRFTKEYAANNDPWYDGRGHHYTIVDSPREGTKLTYGVVKEIATEKRFWHVKVESVEVLLFQIDLPKGLEVQTIEELRCSDTDDKKDIPCSSPNFKGKSWERTDKASGFVRSTIIKQFTGEDTTLEATVDLVDSLRKEPSNSLCKTVVRYKLGKHMMPSEYIERCRGRILGESEHSLQLQSKKIRYVGLGHNCLLIETLDASQVSSDLKSPGLAQVYLHVFFLNKLLHQFSSDIQAASKKSARGLCKQLSPLQTAFLNYQHNCLYHDYPGIHQQQVFYDTCMQHERIDKLHERVNDELKRLEEIANEATEKHLELLLFAIGLMAIPEIFGGFEEHFSWTTLVVDWRFISALITTSLCFVGYWVLNHTK